MDGGEGGREEILAIREALEMGGREREREGGRERERWARVSRANRSPSNSGTRKFQEHDSEGEKKERRRRS